MQGPLDAVPIALIVIVGIFAPLVGWVARQRARNPAIWFVYGGLAGPIALGLLVAAPLGRCPDCDTPVAGWPATCATCGAAVGGLRAALAGSPPAPPRPVGAQISTSGPASPPVTTGARVPVIPPSDAAAGPSPAIRMAGAGTSAVPASASASASGSSDTASERVLATGVYLSGNAGMEVGALYAIARVDDHIRVFGPVDAGQLTVRFERRLDDAEITGLDDRIVITGRSGRTPPSFVLRAVGGMRGPTLEAALATGTHGDVVQGSRR